MLPITHVRPVQVDEVKSDEVICTSRNSAQLNGLLTVFHTERSADSLQNIQNDLPILTEYDKKVSAHSRKACLIRNVECLERGTLRPPLHAACRAFEGETMNIVLQHIPFWFSRACAWLIWKVWPMTLSLKLLAPVYVTVLPMDPSDALVRRGLRWDTML